MTPVMWGRSFAPAVALAVMVSSSARKRRSLKSPRHTRRSWSPLRWPLFRCQDSASCLRTLRDLGASCIAGHRGPNSQALRQCTTAPKRWVVVVGNEDRGVHPSLLPLCNIHCHIPMANGSDSLNVGAATAILLHHFISISSSV